MKKTSRIIVMVLAIVMIFAICTTAFAVSYSTINGYWWRNSVSQTQKGQQNVRVGAVQRVLKCAGYSVGNVDWIFGSGTEACVKSFQGTISGATRDGVVGPVTWGGLQSNIYATPYAGWEGEHYSCRGGSPSPFGGAWFHANNPSPYNYINWRLITDSNQYFRFN